MKFLTIFLSLAVAACSCTGSDWFSAPAEAQAEAQKENKPLFILFTAPEWCRPCQQLERTVLSQNDFAERASQAAVLLQIDVSDMSKVPAEYKPVYEVLLAKYSINSVPTMILADSSWEMITAFDYTANTTADTLLDAVADAVEKWHNSLWQQAPEAAFEQAKAENKPVFILFTAPGWCRPCQNLEANVLSQNDFAEKAAKIAVLLELDFSDPEKIPVKLRRSYFDLAEKYDIAGYPTMLVTTPDGELLAEIPNLRNLTPESLLAKIEAAAK